MITSFSCRENALSSCANVIDVDAFVSRCLETTCNCLEGAQGNATALSKCRCDTLQSFVVDCLTADNSIDLLDWRMQNDCRMYLDFHDQFANNILFQLQLATHL